MLKNLVVAALVMGWCGTCSAQYAPVPPGGRITYNPGIAEMRADYVNGHHVYYAPNSPPNQVSVYNGTTFTAFPIMQSATDKVGLDLALDSSFPANTIFDYLIVSTDGVSARPCAVAWADSTPGVARRAVPIDVFGGQLVNAEATTCKLSSGATYSVPQYQGSYVGKFVTSSAPGYVDFRFGNAGVGGGAAFVSISNAYNQVPGTFVVQDTNVAWAPQTVSTPQGAGWEPLDVICAGCAMGHQTNVINFLSEGTAVDASISMGVYPSTGSNIYVGVAINSVSGVWSKCGVGLGGPAASSSVFHQAFSRCAGYVPDGLNYLQAMELGNNGPSSGLLYSNQNPQLGALTAIIMW